jgi:glycylpeptide N-tetradecanoyltransferase
MKDPETHRITDFFSFYSLPSTALKVTSAVTIDAAYLYYIATELPHATGAATSSNSVATTWDKESPEARAHLKQRLVPLIWDALTLASKVRLCGLSLMQAWY